MEPIKTPKQDLIWLKDLQKRSWEPEVLISGITLAFLFAFPTQIYSVLVTAIQDYGLSYLGAWILLLYTTTVLSIFKLFFVSHLLLRMAWAGLLGLSYAFPKGVIKENLFKQGQGADYPTPVELVLRLERICSMAFAFPVSIGMIILSITFVLVVMLTAQVVFSLDFFMVYLLFIFFLLSFTLFILFTKNSSFKKKFASRLDSTIQAMYQSNLGKWTMLGYLFGIFLLSIPFSISDSKHFGYYFNQAGLSDQNIEWVNSGLVYDSNREPGRRFPRVLVDSETLTGNILPIKLAMYAEDVRFVDALNASHKITLDTLQWHELRKPEHLYRIFVNDSLVRIIDWRSQRMPGTDQPVIQGLLDVSMFKPGYHDIRVEKLVLRDGMFGSDTEPRLRKNWASFHVIRP